MESPVSGSEEKSGGGDKKANDMKNRTDLERNGEYTEHGGRSAGRTCQERGRDNPQKTNKTYVEQREGRGTETKRVQTGNYWGEWKTNSQRGKNNNNTNYTEVGEN